MTQNDYYVLAYVLTIGFFVLGLILRKKRLLMLICIMCIWASRVIVDAFYHSKFGMDQGCISFDLMLPSIILMVILSLLYVRKNRNGDSHNPNKSY